MAVRIFKVDLLYAIYPYCGFFCGTRPIGVLHMMLVEIGHECVDVAHAETKVVIAIAFVGLLFSLYQMKMSAAPIENQVCFPS